MEAQATYKRKNGQAPQQPGALSAYVFGKVQPQAVDLEQAVLGALMLDRDALMVVSDILRPESFYTEAHQAIYAAIVRLSTDAEPVDILTVEQAMRKSGDLEKAGGAYYLVELTHRVASAANIEYHARIVAQKHVMREMIRICTVTTRDAYEETTDVFQLLDTHENSLLRVRSGKSVGTKKITDLTVQVLRTAEEAAKARERGGIVGIPTGVRELNTETGGFRRSDLTVIGARPGMGKSALLNTIALAAAKGGHPVGIFSLEMSAEQLVARMVSAESKVNGRHIGSGNLHDADWQKMQPAVDSINGLPLHIDDSPALNILELRARARRMKMMHGVEIILLDYLQLMSPVERAGNREQQVAEISRGLKQLAKELDVPVVALAQLSRAVEVRGGSKRPQLSDLRESGAVEQDSDNVFFIYRPEYYGITENEDGIIQPGFTELIIAKNRHGRAGSIYARATYIPEHTIFLSYEDAIPEPAMFPANAPKPATVNIPRMAEEDIPF